MKLPWDALGSIFVTTPAFPKVHGSWLCAEPTWWCYRPIGPRDRKKWRSMSLMLEAWKIISITPPSIGSERNEDFVLSDAAELWMSMAGLWPKPARIEKKSFMLRLNRLRREINTSCGFPENMRLIALKIAGQSFIRRSRRK